MIFCLIFRNYDKMFNSFDKNIITCATLQNISPEMETTVNKDSWVLGVGPCFWFACIPHSSTAAEYMEVRESILWKTGIWDSRLYASLRIFGIWVTEGNCIRVFDAF